MQDLLSQEEIDALLNGIDDASSESSAADAMHASDQADELSIQAYGFADLPHYRRSELPGLDILNRAIAELISQVLGRELQLNCQVDALAWEQISLADYREQLIEPAMQCPFLFQPSGDRGMFVFDKHCVFRLLDKLYGGNGNLSRQRKQTFSSLEQRLIQRLISALLDGLPAVLKRTILQLSSAAGETDVGQAALHVQLLSGSTDESEHAMATAFPDSYERLTMTRFQVQLGAHSAELQCLFSASWRHRYQRQLKTTLKPETSVGNATAGAPWQGRRLLQNVRQSPVRVTASLHTADMTVAELLSLQDGAILALDSRAQLQIEGRNCLNGQYRLPRSGPLIRLGRQQ